MLKRILWVLIRSASLIGTIPAIPHTAEIKSHRFVCVEVLQPSQPNGVMQSAVSLPNHAFTGQA